MTLEKLNFDYYGILLFQLIYLKLLNFFLYLFCIWKSLDLSYFQFFFKLLSLIVRVMLASCRYRVLVTTPPIIVSFQYFDSLITWKCFAAKTKNRNRNIRIKIKQCPWYNFPIYQSSIRVYVAKFTYFLSLGCIEYLSWTGSDTIKMTSSLLLKNNN